MIVVPSYIDFVLWSRTLIVDLPSLNIPLVFSEENWKEWGNRLIEENELTTVPLTNNFPNWKIWAEYFINNV